MRAKLITIVAGILFSTPLLMGVASAQGVYNTGTVGTDISWPNCTAKVSSSAFGIVGVTNGLGYSTNPCLKTEASHFSNLSLYVNTGWYSGSSNVNPTSPHVCVTGDNNCLAYNYGYNAGLYAYNAATGLAIHSTTWWLDVETSNTWSSDALQNQNSLQGEADALTTAGVTTVGVYSTTAQWQSVTGGWQNGMPNWGATTWTTAKQASKYCSGHNFSGGGTWLIQFSGKLDQDYVC
jgi:hypothetical protein